MYYARKTQSSTRLIGIVIAIAVNLIVGYVLVTGMGDVIIKKLVDTQVVIIEKPKVEDKEPPPPPPVDVDLPPPPPQVILPEFTFDTPPPPTAITQVAPVTKPAPPAAAKPPPAPPPPPVLSVRPSPGRDFAQFLADNYPASARRAKEEGEVPVTACVDERGKITEVKLAGTSGHSSLDDATVKYLPQARFTPAKDQYGKVIKVCPYSFIIAWQLK